MKNETEKEKEEKTADSKFQQESWKLSITAAIRRAPFYGSTDSGGVASTEQQNIDTLKKSNQEEALPEVTPLDDLKLRVKDFFLRRPKQ